MKKVAILAAIIFSLPLLVSNSYYLNVLAFVGLYFLVTLGLTIFIGYAGQISLGHGAFYALGAYGSALLGFYAGLDPWGATLVTLLFTAFGAGVLGFFILRLQGHYLVMATLALNLIVYFLLIEAEEITGGVSGLPGIPPFCAGSFCFQSDLSNFYLIWGIALVIFVGVLKALGGRLGRELKAIKASEDAARALGLPVLRYKVGTFVFSAVLTALAGALYAHYLTFISPKTFDVFYSIEVVTMVLVGGMGNPWGAFWGALFLTPLPQILSSFDEYKDLIYGLILMSILIFYPQGITSWWEKTLKKTPSFSLFSR